MTEPTSSPAPTEAPVEQPQSDSLSLTENLEAAKRLRSENKTQRERAKAAETELEATKAQLAAMRRTEVERLAGAELIDPADLWNAHADVAEFLTDDGTIDAGLVNEAAQAITAAKPHLAAEKKTSPPPSDRPVEGLRSGATPDTRPSPAPTWAEAIRR
jgi:hypothetical protein